MTPRVGVLALQGDVREHLRALRAVGCDALSVRRPEDLDRADALVLPGGESTTIAKLAAGFGLLEPLQKQIAAGMPAFGSCAGMILLADRLVDAPPDQPTIGGLDVTVRRNAFGRQVDSFEGPIEFTGATGAPLHAVFIRAPWVEQVGPGVEVLARLGGAVHSRNTGEGPGPTAEAIVAVRQGKVLATAFHPELTGDLRVHRLFLRIVEGAA